MDFLFETTLGILKNYKDSQTNNFMHVCSICKNNNVMSNSLTISLCPAQTNHPLLLNRYSIVKEGGKLGNGNFISTFLIQDTHSNNRNTFYALKVIKREMTVILENEFKTLCLLSRTSNSSIPKVYRFFCTKEHSFLIQQIFSPFPAIIRTDYSTLLDILRMILRDVCSTLLLLHSQNVIHADIKLQNILYNTASPFSKIRFQLIDYGNCIDLNNTNTQIEPLEINTLLYRPPELLLTTYPPSLLIIHPSIDIWALGILLIQVASGKHPLITASSLEEIHLKKLIYEIRDGEKCTRNVELVKLTGGINDFYFINLLDKMLSIDPTKRPSVQEILNHPFLFC